MTADERTCAEVAGKRFGYLQARATFAAIHPDLPDMPAATLRRYIALGQWVDSERAERFTYDPHHAHHFLRSIGADAT